MNHVHAGGVAILTVVAIMYATHFLVRTVAGRHANSPIAQGLAYGL